MKVSLELNYSEKAFMHDLKILKKIYSKEYLNEEGIPEDLRKEVELLKLYEFVYDPRIYAKTHGRIDLNYKEVVNGMEIFSKFVSYHTREPEFSLDTRDLEAVISLIQGGDIYLQFEEEKSSKNKIWLEPSGAVIQGRICLPYKYLGRVRLFFYLKTDKA